jgi:NAD dependent epimerase/dehydratase family enzyme
VVLEDLVAAYLHVLGGASVGVFNVAAPNPVQNAEFVRTLGRVLKRPTIVPLPGAAVRLVWGEMGEEMLLGGQRAVPERLEAEGFAFTHPELGPALAHVLR